jgi:predicted TIM-barrel fold metal-dependent hydrolase
MRIDLHAHAFADTIAERAMTALMAAMPTGYRSEDGRLGTLADQLTACCFDAAAICSIATKPSQFDVIRKWSEAIRNGAFGEAAARLAIPLLSVHPEDPERYQHIEQTARAGFKGIKLHPYYQGFALDSPAAIDLLDCARRNGLVVVCHVGFDIAFPRERLCDPVRVRRLLDALPDLKFVASHLGGWMDWDESERLLIGQPIDIEISMSLDYLPPGRVRDLLLRHPADRLYFGSDWPWSRHDEQLARLEALQLPADRMRALMGGNAARLLGLSPG